MTIRYVLKADVVLGINRGYTCANAYVTEYKVDKDVTNDKVPFNSEGYSTVSDAVYELMYSYFKCIDESNHLGLYSLVQNYDEIDKYIENGGSIMDLLPIILDIFKESGFFNNPQKKAVENTKA